MYLFFRFLNHYYLLVIIDCLLYWLSAVFNINIIRSSYNIVSTILIIYTYTRVSQNNVEHDAGVCIKIKYESKHNSQCIAEYNIYYNIVSYEIIM